MFKSSSILWHKIISKILFWIFVWYHRLEFGKVYWSYQFPPSPFERQPHEMVKHTQTIPRQQPTNCLNVFDHFVRLVLKGLTRCVTGLKWDNFEETILPNSVILLYRKLAGIFWKFWLSANNYFSKAQHLISVDQKNR